VVKTAPRPLYPQEGAPVPSAQELGGPRGLGGSAHLECVYGTFVIHWYKAGIDRGTVCFACVMLNAVGGVRGPFNVHFSGILHCEWLNGILTLTSHKTGKAMTGETINWFKDPAVTYFNLLSREVE
jgi:hypothetical protein